MIMFRRKSRMRRVLDWFTGFFQILRSWLRNARS